MANVHGIDLCIDDFVKSGGDAYGVLKEPGRIISSMTTGYVEKDALENYLKSLPDKKVSGIYGESQKRITIK